jgi:aryl-phospho-beta-D-glucosidase BglC (GH1 family)
MSTTPPFNLGTCLAAALALCAQSAMAAELQAVDFLKTDGTVLKREGGKGAIVTLRGTNLGGWFVQEGWMSPNGSGAISREGWLASGTGDAPQSALGGNPDTSWHSGSKEVAGGFRLDLGQLRAFDQVVVDYGSEPPPSGLAVQVSRDGSTWVTARTQTTDRSARGVTLTLDNACTARYLRFTASTDSPAHWAIAEINLLQNDDYTVRMALLRRFGEKEADRLLRVYQDAWIKEADIDCLEAMGMNVVRIPLNWLDFVRDDGTWKADPWTKLDWVVEACRKRGIYVILDMHAVPGGASPWASSGRAGDDGTGQNPNGFWTEPEYQRRLIGIWEKIAAHYRSSPAIAGYDLINEPLVHFDENPRPGQKYSDAALQKAGLFDRIYRAVRVVDPDHVILVAAYTVAPPDNTAYIGTPSSFIGITPPSFHGWNNVVYETHHYDMPNARSHEAQHGLVVNALKDIARFQKEWKVPIYAGEYSLYGFYDVWAEWMTGLNALNVSWTNWTYKVRGVADEPGGGNWGFYNNNQNAVPDINNDSADTIAAKWSRFTTAEFTRNSQLIDVVSRHTPGLPSAADAPHGALRSGGPGATGDGPMAETVARRPVMDHLHSTAVTASIPTDCR